MEENCKPTGRKTLSSKVFLEILSIILLILTLILFFISKARISLVDKDLPLKSETVLKYCLQIEDFKDGIFICLFFILLSIIFKILSLFFRNTFLSFFTIIIFILTLFFVSAQSNKTALSLDNGYANPYIHISCSMIGIVTVISILVQSCIIIVDLISFLKNLKLKNQEKTESQKKIKSEE